MKNIAILGSTGSIGRQALEVARNLGERVRIVAIAARENIDLLEEQAREFHPEIIGVYDTKKAIELQRRLPKCKIVGGMEGLLEVASYHSVNYVVSAMSGTVGLQPTLAAIEAGKNIGLANKEALISGGALVMKRVREKNIQLFPMDSEHSAIFQCLKNEPTKGVERIILTASGGPFRNYTDEQLDRITAEDALKHPTWRMGPKITIDCSTLMNKGLEVIEAFWLFNIPIDKIDVVVHPQSIIHSMVEFVDNSIIAQMGEPSMKTPIQYAITFPERCPGTLKKFDFLKNSVLQFLIPDKTRFRCLGLAYDAIKIGGSLPCYMNAANEILVQHFLKGQIGWKDIGYRLENLMSRHKVQEVDSIETILAVDALAREEASECELSLL
ncbi:MAG: 1-deoxy-D-xylulose-5-phosphate reductoisomerase [Parachlamydiaceae bacterium]|nr:1-deoxy-D-xylulose-5-phosphate reductoisomerase [Parachlamydiaceae bacterium]